MTNNPHDFVKKQLLALLQQSDVGMILMKQAKERILSRGADIGGYAALWADTAKLNVGTKAKPKMIDHYRKGGVPLFDTGENIFNSLTATTEVTANGVRLTLVGSAIAAMQSKGFKRTGNVTIPFTRRAVRGDKKGENENLRVKGGITVPARPIFAMPKSSVKEIAVVIAQSLGAR